jgi:outer membrane receptor for ferrienterochelin and colicin
MMAMSYTPQLYAPGNMSMITGGELRARGSSRNLQDALSTLRPSFLRYRGIRPTVVIDGVSRGSVETLNDITLEAVERIQLLSGPEATIRYGTLHSGAVLLVTTRRR